MDPRSGDLLGDYRLGDRLGRGGMGTVFRARHRRLGRTVALKVLRDAALAPRFLNEARIQAGLRHAHIATLYDYFEADGRACIAMELVEGETFADRVRRTGPLSFPEAVRLLRPVAEAVAYLHAHGVIHRDLKSHNVKVTPEGRVALLDFGIAKDLSARSLTTGDAVPGTPEYLSPEQVHGQAPDARSDVWALGVLLYELLTGDVPFRAPSAFSLFERITRGAYDPPSARVRTMPPEADALVARCLRPDPADRFADAGALLRALPASGPTPRSNGPRPGGLRPGGLRPGGLRPGGLRPEAARPARTGASASRVATWAAWGFAAVALVVLAAVALWPGPPSEAPPEPPRTEAVVPTGATPADVVIDALGPPAEVYRNGRRLGTTPLTLATYVGEAVEVELRRGDAREPLRFQTTSGKRAYTVTLRTP
ncbi:MAG: serine/threonine-protein kinase [Bacteroidota bacterium]